MSKKTQLYLSSWVLLYGQIPKIQGFNPIYTTIYLTATEGRIRKNQ